MTKPRSRIHYNPDREDYSVNEYQLEELSKLGRNQYKEYCVLLVGLCVPCLLNAFSLCPSPFELTSSLQSLSLLLNFFFGVIGVLLIPYFAVNWYRSNKASEKIVNKIKSQPVYDIKTTTTTKGGMGKSFTFSTSHEEETSSSGGDGSSKILVSKDN
jgi:hypothetical protein